MIFGSDNQTGASRQVLDTLKLANEGYTHGYGDDEWTEKAVSKLKEVFECDVEVFFVSTGTASNSLALSCMVQPWEIILCHDHAHIFADESTAPELFSGGARTVPVSNGSGKITVEHIHNYLQNAGIHIPHNPCAKALSITQASEAGLVYSPDELKDLRAICKKNGIKLHMDGARFANAVVSCGCSPAELSWKSGVDVLSLGATKCGALLAEAVIFFDKSLAETFTHRRKRSGHLLSKGRVFGSQFVGWLKNDHWLELAKHANRQATQLAESISSVDGMQVVWPVQANEIFVTMPTSLAESLLNDGAEFYEWYTEALPADVELRPNDTFVRLVTSFMTEDSQRLEFCESIRKNCSA